MIPPNCQIANFSSVLDVSFIRESTVCVLAGGEQNTVIPSTGQKESQPQWYDVEAAKGTQFTVTGYSVPVVGAESEQVTTPPHTPHVRGCLTGSKQEVNRKLCKPREIRGKTRRKSSLNF